MVYFRLTILSFFIFIYSNINCQDNIVSANLKLLTSETFNGREAGTTSDQLFYKLLKDNFPQVKFKKQAFKYSKKDNPFIKTCNYYTSVDNKKDSSILFISHYDHFGNSNNGTSYELINKNCVLPGADDNASGVCLNLLLLDSISKLHNQKYNFIFLFTSGHEDGLFGSNYFFDTYKKDKIKYVINFDMVGRMDSVSKTIRLETNMDHSKFSSSSLSIILDYINSSGDHSVFAENAYNTIFITTGHHNDYHKCSDSFDKININGIFRIADFIFHIVENNL